MRRIAFDHVLRCSFDLVNPRPGKEAQRSITILGVAVRYGAQNRRSNPLDAVRGGLRPVQVDAFDVKLVPLSSNPETSSDEKVGTDTQVESTSDEKNEW